MKNYLILIIMTGIIGITIMHKSIEMVENIKEIKQNNLLMVKGDY